MLFGLESDREDDELGPVVVAAMVIGVDSRCVLTVTFDMLWLNGQSSPREQPPLTKNLHSSLEPLLLWWKEEDDDDEGSV